MLDNNRWIVFTVSSMYLFPCNCDEEDIRRVKRKLITVNTDFQSLDARKVSINDRIPF